MLYLSARLTKKKILGLIIGLVTIIGAALILFSGGGGGVTGCAGATNEERVEYLTGLGWQVDSAPLEEQEIIIPREFSGVYSDYAALQRQQGFDLEACAGSRAMRYTYKVKNYPTGDDTVVADIIVLDGKIVAGDIQSVARDGFMIGLEKKQ